MRKLTIALDLDGMCYDLLQRWLDRVNEDWGTAVSKADVRTWDVADAFRDTVPKKEVYRYLREPGMFSEGAAIPGAREAVEAMLSRGHEVFVLSSPSGPLSAAEKLEWVPRALPLGERDVTLSAQKDRFRADALLDDHGDTLHAFAAANPGALCAGIRYEYNAGQDDPGAGVHLIPDYRDPAAAWSRIVQLIDQKAAS